MRKSSESPFELVDLDRSGHRQPTNADARQCENRVGQRWRNGRDADLTNTRRCFRRVDQVDLYLLYRLHAHDWIAIEILGKDVATIPQHDLTPGGSAQPP